MKTGMNIRVLALLALAVGSMSSFAANPGSCAADAIKLTMTAKEQTLNVQLTSAYNPDTGVYDETNHVCFYRVTLNRSKAYSLWLTGPDGWQADPSQIDFYAIEPREADPEKEEFEPMAMFVEYTGKWKPGSMQVMTEDEWYIDPDDPEMSDPPKWDYIIQISGVARSATATLHYVQGNMLPLGIDDNPAALNVTLADQRTGLTAFVDGEFSYVYSAEFQNGRRYVFATLGGTEGNPYSVGFDASGKVTPYELGDWKTPNNAAWSFDPDTDGAANIRVTETLAQSGAFQLRYKMVPARSIAQHSFGELPVGGAGVRFVPGRINAGYKALGVECHDAIIDQALFHCTLVKGARYVAETNGSKTNLIMRVYDGTGNVLHESLTRGDGSYDVRCGFIPTYSGNFYIGVCQKLDDDDLDEPMAGNEVTLTVEEVVPREGIPDEWDPADDTYEGATMLTPARGIVGVNPKAYDTAGTEGWHKLGKTDWYDTFAIVVRKGLTYAVSTSAETLPLATLSPRIFYMNGKKEVTVSARGDINPITSTGLIFTADRNGVYYIRLNTASGYGYDYPGYKVHAMVYDAATGGCDQIGLLKVSVQGCETATWTLGSESIKYKPGTVVALPVAAKGYTVKFSKEKGFNAVPATQAVQIVPSDKPVEVKCTYSDTYDPKDDLISGTSFGVRCSPPSWSLKDGKPSPQSRTLWDADPADYFKFSAADGNYYNFCFNERVGDAVLSLCDAQGNIVGGQAGVNEIVKQGLVKGTYYLKVSHRNEAAKENGAYVVDGFYAKVGAIKLDKTSYKVKENAASVTVKVKRTAKSGQVKARIRTVEGEHAKSADNTTCAKEDRKFYPVDEVLTWENGDNKDKTITIKLIPDVLPLYHNYERSFTIKLEDAGDGQGDNYPAVFSVKEAPVILTESQSKKTVTPENPSAAYKQIKTKTVKQEVAPLRTGTYFGAIEHTTAGGGKALDGNVARAGSIKLTTSVRGETDSLSASVKIANKTYTFKTDSKNPQGWEDIGGGLKRTTLFLAQTVNKVAYSNEMTITVQDAVDAAAAWLDASCTVALKMNIQNAVTKEVEEDIRYAGELYRDNSKVQAFLDRTFDFIGYYTAALEPWNGDKPLAAGDIPAGNGYLLVTIDNGGKAKVVFKMADNKTGATVSSIAACIRRDPASATGYALYVPIFSGNAKYGLAGTLKLVATDVDNLDNNRKLVVVDTAASKLTWYSDDTTLSVGNDHGFALDLVPTGGFYDTVERLQRHYFNRDFNSFKVDTVGVDELPDAMFTIGGVTYGKRITEQQADGFKVDLQVDKFVTPSKKLVKGADRRNDFANSVNPANVKVSIARATGLVTGSFSVWAEAADGRQKEITGSKHAGVLLMSRGEIPANSALREDTITAGYMTQSVTVPDGARTRKWTYSAPFNIKGYGEYGEK